MRRLTISLDDDLAEAYEQWERERGYSNRSEAFRDLLRSELGQTRMEADPQGPCVATLTFVYNHHERRLAERLTDMQHEHHELTVSSMHAHLDHEQCIETVILRGPTAAVQSFARSVMAETGVRHGHLHLVAQESASGKPPPHRHRRKA